MPSGRKAALRCWPDTEIGEADTLEQGFKLARSDNWDVAVLDLSLPDASGLEGLTHLRRAHVSLPILVLSMHDETAYASRALQQGASG
ncbi:MAG TPA: response regulator transcription factor [Thiobacillus sp.]|nr:response regulator transcription factor [Thiobacillus sp.]HQT69146.1 response regulator transcription factor [Thiobacillus sp.]